MNDPSLYFKSNTPTKRDAQLIIDNYFGLINWQNDENILDVGSGDGAVILDVILPKFPKNFHQLVCIDVSNEMVEFARKRCDNPKTNFIRLDIATTKIPQQLRENFNHIFSFYCLQWVQDQRQAFKNLFDMLKPGGELLLTFLLSAPVFEIYENMAKLEKWSPYMNNFKKFISPYYYSDNPEKDLEDVLRKEGFITKLCKIEDRTYTFENLQLFINLTSSVNPFLEKIPKNKVDSYTDEYIREARKVKTIRIETCDDGNNTEKYHSDYKVFIVFASKPV